MSNCVLIKAKLASTNGIRWHNLLSICIAKKFFHSSKSHIIKRRHLYCIHFQFLYRSSCAINLSLNNCNNKWQHHFIIIYTYPYFSCDTDTYLKFISRELVSTFGVLNRCSGFWLLVSVDLVWKLAMIFVIFWSAH